jgi:hypothetical protein
MLETALILVALILMLMSILPMSILLMLDVRAVHDHTVSISLAVYYNAEKNKEQRVVLPNSQRAV